MLEIINKSNNSVFYATTHSAGFDIPAAEDFSINPREIKIISTGLYLGKYDGKPYQIVHNSMLLTVIPELQIRSRSGLAAKHGIAVLNSPGTIDIDYSKEIKVILINHGEETVSFKAGDRIAQGVVAMTLPAFGVPTKAVERSGGFGSTGV